MNNKISSVRKMFIDFFNQKKHKTINSSTLVPIKDSTLLFTNAGMNQFKNIFLGKGKIKYKRVVNVQRCLRAGGKHNDLENVGYSPYHHTFFEMLGNFSFGDYFKETAINLAWELLTSKKWFNIPQKKLLVTIYYKDDETFNIWNKTGISEKKIIRIGNDKQKIYESDNFWMMGETGPCGPCTEIFFDCSENVDQEISSELFFKKKNNSYIEIWNIVFMQYNKILNGDMLPLKITSVDTGMGLERITSILQNVNSNYEIDFFYNLIKKISQIMNVDFDLKNSSLKVIADHIRASVFLISDGVIPSNIKRGYVLRRIIRRAIRHGSILGNKTFFFYKLVPLVIQELGSITEYLKKQQKFIQQILYLEEQKYQDNIKNGLAIFNKEIKKLKNNKLDGYLIFRLYDTFGLPMDLIEDLCIKNSLKIDKSIFEIEMKKQKHRSKYNNKFVLHNSKNMNNNIYTEFKGYNKLKIKSKIKLIIIDNNIQEKIIQNNQQGIIILERTSFYGESGGQIGDKGLLTFYKNKFLVFDAKKYGQTIYHIGKVISGIFKIGDTVTAIVDKKHRDNTSQNHSAIHLLNASLEKVLDKKIIQQGSYVNNKYLRLDFAHFESVSSDKLKEVEKIVNLQIRKNLIIKYDILPLDLAKKQGFKYLLNEKYEENVRTVKIGNFSNELCCGTHVKRTGEIGIFQILHEAGISNGVRRIEGIIGEESLYKIQNNNEQIKKTSLLLKITDNNVYKKVNYVVNYVKELESNFNILKKKYVLQKMCYLEKNILKIKNINILVAEVNDFDNKMMIFAINNFNNKLKSAIIILSTIINKKIFVITSVTKNLTSDIQASFLIKLITNKIKGNGGGNAILARGTGIDTTFLNTSLNEAKHFIIKNLKNKN